MQILKKPLKIIFAGTPNFAAKNLQSIIHAKHIIVGVLTQPDRPKGRKNTIIPNPVKIIAKKYNIPIFQPNNINNIKSYYKLLKLQADIMIVVAYGVILPDFIIHAFPMGCINIHASLLPRWRGAAPIQWAILNGDKKTGISIIKIEKKLDAGNILYQVPCKILPDETTTSLLKKICKISIKAILKFLINIHDKKIIQKKQNINQVTYASKLSKKMGKIIFSIPAKKIERMIRAFNPWPGTYIQIKNLKIKIHEAKILISKKQYPIGNIIKINKKGIQIQTKKNILNIKKIQFPSKKIITIEQFIQTNNKIFEINQKLEI